jgi:uncharacterized protein
MTEASNTQLVKDAYAAFLRGDVHAILQMVDDNVDWQGVIGTEGVLPQAGRRHGRDQVATFFGQVAETFEFELFEPQEFVAQGDTVAALGHYRAKVRSSSRKAESAWAMVFTVRNGRIVRFREFTDSAQLVKAYTGAGVGA